MFNREAENTPPPRSAIEEYLLTKRNVMFNLTFDFL